TKGPHCLIARTGKLLGTAQLASFTGHDAGHRERAMATIRKLRGKWQAMARRKGVAPRAKSFEKKSEAEQWARQLEAEVPPLTAAGFCVRTVGRRRGRDGSKEMVYARRDHREA